MKVLKVFEGFCRMEKEFNSQADFVPFNCTKPFVSSEELDVKLKPLLQQIDEINNVLHDNLAKFDPIGKKAGLIPARLYQLQRNMDKIDNKINEIDKEITEDFCKDINKNIRRIKDDLKEQAIRSDRLEAELSLVIKNLNSISADIIYIKQSQQKEYKRDREQDYIQVPVPSPNYYHYDWPPRSDPAIILRNDSRNETRNQYDNIDSARKYRKY